MAAMLYRDAVNSRPPAAPTPKLPAAPEPSTHPTTSKVVASADGHLRLRKTQAALRVKP